MKAGRVRWYQSRRRLNTNFHKFNKNLDNLKFIRWIKILITDYPTNLFSLKNQKQSIAISIQIHQSKFGKKKKLQIKEREKKTWTNLNLIFPWISSKKVELFHLDLHLYCCLFCNLLNFSFPKDARKKGVKKIIVHCGWKIIIYLFL